jgi:hypothetical protein
MDLMPLTLLNQELIKGVQYLNSYLEFRMVDKVQKCICSELFTTVRTLQSPEEDSLRSARYSFRSYFPVLRVFYRSLKNVAMLLHIQLGFSVLECTTVGIRCTVHATPTCGGRSVGIVRSRTKATDFSIFSLLCVRPKHVAKKTSSWEMKLYLRRKCICKDDPDLFSNETLI